MDKKNDARKRLDQYLKDMGNKVAEKRKEKGWDEEELATRAGVPVPFITGLENGEYSAGDKLRRIIGKALDFDLNSYADELAKSAP